MRRRPFFSPALQGEDTGVRVPEDPADGVQGAEARKAVRIPEASVFWHPEVMPDFSEPRNRETPCATRTFGDTALNFTHTFWRRAFTLYAFRTPGTRLWLPFLGPCLSFFG